MLLCVIPKDYTTSRTAVDGVKHPVYSAEEIKIRSLTSQALSPRHSSRILWDKKMCPEALLAREMCCIRYQVITPGTWKWSITVSFRGKISGSALFFALCISAGLPHITEPAEGSPFCLLLQARSSLRWRELRLCRFRPAIKSLLLSKPMSFSK